MTPPVIFRLNAVMQQGATQNVGNSIVLKTVLFAYKFCKHSKYLHCEIAPGCITGSNTSLANKKTKITGAIIDTIIIKYLLYNAYKTHIHCRRIA